MKKRRMTTRVQFGKFSFLGSVNMDEVLQRLWHLKGIRLKIVKSIGNGHWTIEI